MIILLDSKEGDYELARQELAPHPVGQLLTPLTRRADFGMTYGIDNGAYSQFNVGAFLAILARQQKARSRCKFVAVPDVVGSARRTLETFNYWADDGGLEYWPLALVAQDGQEALPIPWGKIEAIFIGGTDAFKGSQSAIDIAKAARICGKWVHVGRINTPARFDKWLELADSCDGTGLSQYSHMREALTLPKLFEEARNG